MSSRWVLLMMAVVILSAVNLAPVAAAPASLAVTAQVQSQTCLSGNFVQVTLTAQTSTTSPAAFAWDTNGDGRLESVMNLRYIMVNLGHEPKAVSK